MKIAVVVPSLQRHDAVGNDVLFMYSVLEQAGHDVVVFAESYDETIEAPILPIKEWAGFIRDPRNVVIYHHAIYATWLDELCRARCKKIFRYHNITPSEFFKPYDSLAAEACRRGRRQMEGALGSFHYLLPASLFNLQELQDDYGAYGIPAAVCPPFSSVAGWETAGAGPDRQRRKREAGSINLLSVGRLSPNKNHPMLIGGFFDFISTYGRDAVLHIVGKTGPQKYDWELRSMVAELGLEKRVVFYDHGIDDEALRRLYAEADVFVMTSLHEGFCVPVAEAMAFGLPIISTGAGALAETVGYGGVILEQNTELGLSAALEKVLGSEQNVEMLRRLAAARYEELAASFTPARLTLAVEHVTDLRAHSAAVGG